MDEFEELLSQSCPAVERFVKFRLTSEQDAEDILQEVYITAFQKFGLLRDKDSFKPWIISIARNKCNDYFRTKAKNLEIPIELLSESRLSYGRQGISEYTAVSDTIELLGGKDKQILYLYFWKELPQAEIAKRLGIPLGTVKSRLHTAKRNFKEKYPYQHDNRKGEKIMKKLPLTMPEYKTERSEKEPFNVRWEELMGWCIIPKLGEKLSWGLYDAKSHKLTEHTDMEVVGKAEVHGIEGVEIVAMQYDSENYYRTGCITEIERRFVAQLTDTHSRLLAESHTENGVKKYYTFLDGDSFLDNWGFGENNCGNETQLHAKGLITRSENVITGPVNPGTLDVVGRYTVTINGKNYDTVCVMDINCYDDAVASEQYIDQNGRTVLWRRFNRDDWAFDHFKRTWSEMLPDNERLTINGETYVHWYDFISDYIL